MSILCITLKYTMDGIQAVLKRSGRTDWVYSRDIVGTFLQPAGRSPEWNVYNSSSSSIWSTTDWYRILCSYYPGFKWRLAGRREGSNVFYHGIRDNAPMSASRPYESGYTLQHDIEKAMKDCIAWAEEYPQIFGEAR